MKTCPSCGSENRAEASFCSSCGAAFGRVCPNGHAVPAQARFCDQCGAVLDSPATSAADGAAPRRDAPIAERRLVSVLFADLVGFTALSETRDAEETRDLLSRYFEVARTLIARYGGTVEKFIGDAVMAVWGTPVATEIDAERAVRAALDLVASIPELGSGLKARAGVLTGEAAVTIGAAGEGMVAGDLVNTASRIQTVAEPGSVLVGDVTRRTTREAIVYEDAGEHELKGKSERVALWRALRVVSGAGGALKSAGLEAPFVGRNHELKRIKDLFHSCAQDRRAHMVSVTGIAGIGKSRLAWEFYKYFDGIVDQVYWQRGRCLAYGEGVAYWALADMIRMRARIEEAEEPEAARRKLRATLREHLLDPEELAFVEPRLAHLLGLGDGAVGDREDLFAAWRLFFERLAGSAPTVLAFEDMQWADTSLLDFVEYLLEWSRDYPLYVITLARPELHEQRPGWGAGQRNFTALYLEPLSPESMDELLEGLVPGLPERLRGQILERAQGVPLYAVETVRMLLDRGLLTQEGSVYRPAGEIATLDVPETLHALIAARLDGLSAAERRVLQHAAVLGKTFTAPALAALSGTSGDDELRPMLSGLVRKEVLGVQSDPRSPERGQYGFLQDLVRHVAYETLSKRDRKIRHLAAAAYLEQAFANEDGIAEVLASHYLAAFESAPDADDATAIKVKTRETLSRAGERAGSVGAPEEGRRYYEQAARLADHPHDEAHLLEQAGLLSLTANRPIESRHLLEQARVLYAGLGDAHSAARANAAIADVDIADGRTDEAASRLEEAIEQLEQEKPSADLAAALALLGRAHVLAGRGESGAAPLERALTLAERLLMPEVFVEALTSKALVVMDEGRLAEARIMLEAAASRAHAEQLYASALRAENNLAVVLEALDRHAEAYELVERTTALARRRGARAWELELRTGGLIQLFLLGRWEEGAAIATDVEPRATLIGARGNLVVMVFVHCERGDLEAARALLAASTMVRDSDQPQYRTLYAIAESRVLRAERRHTDALASAERGLATHGRPHFVDTNFKLVVVEAIEAALALADLDKADEILAISEALEPGELTPFLQAQTHRLRASLSWARGDSETVDERLRSATEVFREHGFTFYLAVTQLEHAEWLAEQGRGDDAQPLLVNARETFERLRADPWLERAARAERFDRMDQRLEV